MAPLHDRGWTHHVIADTTGDTSGRLDCSRCRTDWDRYWRPSLRRIACLGWADSASDEPDFDEARCPGEHPPMSPDESHHFVPEQRSHVKIGESLRLSRRLDTCRRRRHVSSTRTLGSSMTGATLPTSHALTRTSIGSTRYRRMRSWVRPEQSGNPKGRCGRRPERAGLSSATAGCQG